MPRASNVLTMLRSMHAPLLREWRPLMRPPGENSHVDRLKRIVSRTDEKRSAAAADGVRFARVPAAARRIVCAPSQRGGLPAQLLCDTRKGHEARACVSRTGGCKGGSGTRAMHGDARMMYGRCTGRCT